jgi:hypothetical protein
MAERDADLFLDWAADAFLAAGRAPEVDERRAHRREAELFCDIFHALNGAPVPPPPRSRPLIGKLLEQAFPASPSEKQG